MITLFVLGERGLLSLCELIRYNINPDTVVIGTDYGVINDFSTDIINTCIDNNISYVARNDYVYAEWDYAFAIGWRWLIKETRNLIIFHDSILPKYRGFNPLVTALINGDTRIGVTALFASEKADEGSIIDISVIDITYPILINEAVLAISSCYKELVLSIANKIINKTPITSREQNNEMATYSLWRDEEDYIINWNESSDKIKRHIDASGFPYFGAKTQLNKKIITVVGAEVVTDLNISNRDVGKICRIDNGLPVVVCGTGLIKLCKAIDINNTDIFPISKLRSRFS